MKDIKREIVIVDNRRFIAAADYDALYARLSDLLTAANSALSGDTRALDHRVQRLLRACSRTVTGFDSYEILAALMEKCEQRCLVTPGMMDNCPIRITSSEQALTINSVNVFKLVAEVADGSVVTVLALRLELTEVLSVNDWSSTRWMTLEPYDKVEDALGPFARAIENYKALIESLQLEDPEQIERMSRLKQEFEEAMTQSTAAIRRLTKEESIKGRLEF